MNFFENIDFMYPLYFLLCIPVFLLILFIYKQQRAHDFFSGFSDLQKIYGTDSFFHTLFFIFLTLISFLFILLLSGPVSYTSEESITQQGIDISLVLDLSYSMVAEDLAPNRLEVAKDVLDEFINTRETDRISLVLFSW